MYMTDSSKEYCFKDAPEDIEEEISHINQENMKTEECSSDSLKVCFEKEKCDIIVDYDVKYVEKNREKMCKIILSD